MMTDGQAQLQTKDREHGVRGITWVNPRMSSEGCSTDRVFFQQQQADHHNVDVRPDGAILEKTGNLQKESGLVKQLRLRHPCWGFSSSQEEKEA